MNTLPELPLHEWEATKLTLHLLTQIAGKIKLAKMPRKNHWWNITLQVNAKGITTGTIVNGAEAFEIQFNLFQHQVEVSCSTGTIGYLPLNDGLSVAGFYEDLMGLLKKMNIQVSILDKPYSLPDEHPIQTPFSRMTEPAAYDKTYVERFWKILLWVNGVFTTFSGRFYGKTCPVQLYWHHLDLTVTRFSGKKVPLTPTMSIANKDAYSHEVISFGFWAGDENIREAAFYSYTYPSPVGLEQEPLAPGAARWQTANDSAMALLMFNDVRMDENPEETLLSFLESAYLAGATLAKWDVSALAVSDLGEL